MGAVVLGGSQDSKGLLRIGPLDRRGFTDGSNEHEPEKKGKEELSGRLTFNAETRAVG